MSQLKNVKLSVAQFDETVPSTGERIKITPFKVGDEKVLLMAAESKDTQQMTNALKQIVGNCTVGVSSDLAFFDYEYLFLKLRAVSVGEVSKIGVLCSNCEAENTVDVDISKVNVAKDDNHSRIVKINDNLGFEMKYPDLSSIAGVNLESFDGIMDLVCKSVSKVYYGEETIDVGLSEMDDLKDLIEGMTTQQFSKFQEFFETIPKLREEVNFTCQSCRHENKRVLEGLQSFF